MNVIERFLKYVSFPTNSDEFCEKCPSTPTQLELGKYIADELRALGLCNVEQDENGYVYAFLPGKGKLAGEPAIGFIAHMDTSPSCRGDNIVTDIIEYKGGDIHLANGTTVISVSDFPEIEALKGEKLIVTDGNTLLGADDKAGVAEIVTLCEKLISSGVDHRPVAVALTPDEEIGRGADLFRVERFEAKVAYTVDGGNIGGIEYENFNAAGFCLKVHGVNIHPGSAKNKMKNAVLMANQFISMLPPAEVPAHTEKYEGFYHITDIAGDETLCTVRAIIRDHDKEKFEERKKFIAGVCDYLETVWGKGTFEYEIHDSYYNMKEMILPHFELIERAEEAFRSVGVEPFTEPVRGGTDGSRLSYMGLPCPNLSTGGYNFHSVREFVPVSSLEKMTAVLEYLTK